MDAGRAQAIREIARAVLRQLYKRRLEIWPEPPASPFEIIEPSAAIWLENASYQEVNELFEIVEDVTGNSRYQELAGKFDPFEKAIFVSRHFGPEALRFSAAHELAHLILHAKEDQETQLFRDPPAEEAESLKRHRPDIEREADIFAAEFLMPSKLLHKTFFQYFGKRTLAGVPLDEEIARQLSESVRPRQRVTAQQLRALGSRDLATLLAKSLPWDERLSSLTLCGRFRVSKTAMAIQLENLGLALTPSSLVPRARKTSGHPPIVSENQPRKPKDPRGFNVFISYDSRDLNEVLKIVQELQRRGLWPWMDKLHLRPGKRWEIEVSRIIEEVSAMAVFLGPHEGERLSRDLESAQFRKRLKDQELLLIPVILPSVQGEPVFPPFLENFTPVDFRQSDPDPFDQLIFGITGRNPLLGDE